MQVLAVAATLALTLIVSAYGQTEGPSSTTTKNPGVSYGGFCNGFLLQCNRYQETVLCLSRVANETVGGETCETGSGVNVGKCQCRRNCRPTGLYEEDGEFDVEKGRCVGLIGKTCSALASHCTAHSTCDFGISKCVCDSGYTTTPDGLRCVEIEETTNPTTAKP